jgi:hypothetical protein
MPAVARRSILIENLSPTARVTGSSGRSLLRMVLRVLRVTTLFG